jgi:thioesterase domain-containing protein
MLGRVAGELGIQLPTTIIADAPTVAEFAPRVKNASAERVRHPSVVPLQVGGQRTPLFCFAGAGGLAIGLLTLAHHFGGQRPVYGLQAHGLEHRGLPDWSVRAAARRHAQHVRLLCPRGPYILLGHSLGGLIAYEVAQLLAAAGETVAMLVTIDTFLPGSLHINRSGVVAPSLRANTPGSESADSQQAHGPLAPLQQLAGRLRQLAQLPFAGVVQYQGMNQYDVFYNLGKVMTMAYRAEPYGGRTLVLLAEGRTDASSWEDVLTGPHTIRHVDRGDHDNLLREPLVAQIAADVEAELDALGV